MGRLLCPSLGAHLLDEPPEFQWLHGIARTVDHTHVAIQVGHVEVGLVVVHVTSAEEQARRGVNAKELMAADGDGLEAHGLVAHHLAVLGEREVASKEGCIYMTIDGGNLSMAVEHSIEGFHVVDSTFEGGAHR